MHSAEHVSAALASLLRPAVDFSALLGASLHVTAVHSSCGDTILRVININSSSPRCSEDFFLLNCTRALAGLVLQSWATVEAEGGEPAGVAPALAAPLAAWRARTLGQQRGSCSAPVAHVLLTRGERAPLSPSLPIFSPSSSSSSAQPCPSFAPYLAAPPHALPGLLSAFPAAAAPPPQCLPVPREHLSLLHALRSLRSAGRGSGGSACGDSDPWQPLLRLRQPGALVTVEAGPTLCRPLYTLAPAGGSGAGADGEHWVAQGQPALDCPLDFVLLTTLHHDGSGVPQAAQGLPLVRRGVLEALFSVRASGGVSTAAGRWSFELLERRGRVI